MLQENLSKEEFLERYVNTFICGDALETLRRFPDECIDMVITSPPYYGLRDYHAENQIGLEPTFQEYLDKLIDIMREVKRVLKPTGSAWINLGDCYGSHTFGKSKLAGGIQKKLCQEKEGFPRYANKSKSLGDKCLGMIPERFAIRCVDELGFILRNRIIWAKMILIKKENRTMGSAMPTSIKDRFNETYEYLFFFVKNRKYYSNLDAVRIKHAESTWKRLENEFYEGTKSDREGAVKARGLKSFQKRMKETEEWKRRHPEKKLFNVSESDPKKEEITSQIARKYGYDPEGICPVCGRTWKRHASPNAFDRKEGIRREFIPCVKTNKLSTYTYAPADKRNPDFPTQKNYGLRQYQGKFAGREDAELFGSPRARTQRERLRQTPESEEPNTFHPLGKNCPSVWLIHPQPHNFQKELGVEVTEHFAVFPESLLEIPIKFACPPGGLILDPFMGSGTTAIVARRLGRNFIGIDVSPEYCELAKLRLQQEETPNNQQRLI